MHPKSLSLQVVWSLICCMVQSGLHKRKGKGKSDTSGLEAMSQERKDGYQPCPLMPGKAECDRMLGSQERRGKPSSFSILLSGQHQSCH